MSSSAALLKQFVTLVLNHPYQAGVAAMLTLCFATRIITGLQSKGQDLDVPTKRVKVTPYWIPFIGSAFSFSAGTSDYIAKLGKKANDGVVAIHLGGNIHHFLLSPSLAKAFYAKRSLSTEDMIYHFTESFLGDPGSMRGMSKQALWGDVHRTLNNMMRDEFVNTGMQKVVNELQRQTPQLMSFSRSPLDQHVWERHSRVTIEDPDTAVVDLWSLERNFVGDIASRVLMGQNFMDNNPNLLEDMWTFDTKINQFLMGLPRFMPGMAAAHAARDRTLAAMERWSRALRASMEGKDPGHEWSDLSDVSDVMRVRTKAWWDTESPQTSIGPGDLAVLWSMNVNANAVIFWMIYRIITIPNLLSRIREEIAPYARLTTSTDGFSTTSLSLDLDPLCRSCPLLKATYFETMRFDSRPFSYKKVVSDTIVTESAEDASLLGKSNPQSYLLPAGSFAAISHGSIQSDANFWPEPETFNPDRFLVPATPNLSDEKSSSPPQLKADMKHLTPFGGGVTICKGRTFAEREILLFSAAMLTCWDFEPVDPAKGWVTPKKIPMSATDYTDEWFVRLRRRKV